jgi:hypothetical protein
LCRDRIEKVGKSSFFDKNGVYTEGSFFFSFKFKV